jgi:hypothetical protein
MEEYRQAVYIMKREAKDVIATISAKCKFDPTSIFQVVNIIQSWPSIKVDDNLAHELPKCHDMVLDLSRMMALLLRREWDKVADATFHSEEVRAVLDAIESEGYLLKLIF